MSDCTFCDKGVQPFYDLDEKQGRKICHTCFHLGKHKIPRPTEPSTTKSQPVAVKPVTSSSTSTKR
jgi:hypothetical protein